MNMRSFFAGIAIFLCFHLQVSAQLNMLLNLNGPWKFSIGDNRDWSEPDFDDSQWESIQVPSAWEDQGFFGYDGYAWYRKEFDFDKTMKNKDLYIALGYIDDVDEVYLNGHLVGFSGTFPPHFSTSYEALRRYPLPAEYINSQGKNLIAVKIYNHHMSGGIISGDVGIFSYDTFHPEISLLGIWQFRAGDNKLYREFSYNDRSWHKVIVPGNWKNFGYKEYDGIAWYRCTITLPEDFEQQKLIFIAGKIDCSDEVYINGKLIGQTGSMPAIGVKNDTLSSCTGNLDKQIRVYAVPDNVIRVKKENLICIRVLNARYKGGIIEGPVGFSRLSSYARFLKDRGNQENSWPQVPQSAN